MHDDIKMDRVTAAMFVDSIHQELSLIMLNLSSLLNTGLQHGMISSEDYFALKDSYKTYVKAATLLKAHLNVAFAKLLTRNGETNDKS